MFDKNTSLQYPLISEIDAYSVDTFCTAETLGCVYSIYTADILAVLNPSKTSLKFAVLYDQSTSAFCTITFAQFTGLHEGRI